jgi:hypothetical protein
MRKGSRKGNRKTNRKMNGGAAVLLSPMALNDTSMVGPSRMSGAQGLDFFKHHATQHGGMAPVGYTGMMSDPTLRGAARMGGLDAAIADATAHGQAGGKRRRSRKAGRKSRKTRGRKMRKTRGRSRKMRGGMRELGYMSADAPGTLLQGMQARAALSNMNHEWRMAENPRAFAPGGI